MSAVVSLFNGSAETPDLTLSRGLHYGDGVFRTLLYFDGAWRDWDRQIEKLTQDAAVLGLIAPSAAELLTEADSLVKDEMRAVLKIMLWRRGAGRGYWPEAANIDRLLLRYAAPLYSPECWTRGVFAVLGSIALSQQPQLAGIKHLNRLEQVLASRDWPEDCQESLMLSSDGMPVCGTRGNLFWVRDGRLFTPELTRCGVAGMMRARVIEIAGPLGIELVVADHPLASLMESDEAFLSNSLIGIWPLRALDSHRWPAPGKLTQMLMRKLAHPQLTASP